MQPRRPALGIASVLLGFACHAADGSFVVSTLGCTSPPPQNIVIYEIDGRYPTVTELLDFTDGTVHEIRVTVPNPNAQAQQAMADFFLSHGMAFSPLGACTSDADCKQ
jgi:hypothetical protein